MYRRYDQGLGLYIHIPFCLKKCNYCDFYSLPVQTGILQRYVRAVVKELELRARDVEDRRIKSVYLGGGTPSLLSPSELSLIINSINLNWDLDNEAEVSLEANPASLNGKALEFIHKAGFNRISLGVQSFQDRDLQILGRSHSSQEAWQSIELIKNSGFSNLNLDLIYGIPGQTIDKWQETLAQALDARPAHLSVYLLQLDEEVPLSRYIKAGHYQLCDEDTEAQMYQLAIQMIEKAGLFQYEISNFARPGYECQHNLGYWKANEYLGIGPGAVSFQGNRRYINKKNLLEYLGCLEKDQEPETEELEFMDAQELAADAIILGLRLCTGIKLKDLVQTYGINELNYYKDIIEGFINQGLLEMDKGYLRLSRKAYFLSNQVICHFLPDLES
ncbi:MAG: radical SAM family heme chaperone HemW [Syntrophomonadaceae bacterium]|jgi:oxygen-independent coproporphyrinogen-3 oxidase|nr:radical SAM family heme chaperone HemW [Syntrophomonadaceae bacterium]